MTSTQPGTVAALRRPAVHASTLVRSDVKHTFDVFVRTISAWWPTKTVSAGKERVCDVSVEPRPGGRVFETWDDGSEHSWGVITEWNPPAGFTVSWEGTPAPTEVELRFTGLGPSLTRITVEHRGWERLTEEQLAQDCASPGGYSSGSYDQGWKQVLEAFTSCARPPFREDDVAGITDDHMLSTLTSTKQYSFVLLKQGPNYDAPATRDIIWEHGRRNFALRANGVLAIVCPVMDDSDRCGIGIFDANIEETTRIITADPGVRAGVFTFEIHPVRGFPGDRLPG